MAGLANFGNTEILQVADAVAREKGIEKELVIQALENSIEVAARKKYGYDRHIKADIDKKSGEIKLHRIMQIVDNDIINRVIDEDAKLNEDGEVDEENKPFNPAYQILLKDAQEKEKDAEIGGEIIEPLPPIDLGRVAAQTAKQVIIQKVRDAERDKQFEDYKDRIGEIVNGIVKRVEYGNVILELGRAEAIIRRDSLIRGETFKINDRIRAYVKDVHKETKGPQIFLSRTASEFMSKLFAQEVPEIYDGLIEIKAVAREPGSRAKIAVATTDSNIDPVGSCVGVRGSRVQAVINELQGEKIDIIQWNADPAAFVVSALVPAEVAKVVIDEDNQKLGVVVPDEQLSLAIGRRGQNVRLASELIGWKIDVMTEQDASDRRTAVFTTSTDIFMEALNVEEVIAQLLAAEGFSTVEEVAFVDSAELESIEGFDAAIAEALQERAKSYLVEKSEEVTQKLNDLKISEDLQSLEGLTPELMVQLAGNKIITLDDFADLSRDEFIEIAPDSNLSNNQIDELIMKARAHWFEDEEKTTDKVDKEVEVETEPKEEQKEKGKTETKPKEKAETVAKPQAKKTTASKKDEKKDKDTEAS